MKKEVIVLEQAEAFLRTMPREAQGRFRRIAAMLERDGFIFSPYGEKIEGRQNLFAIRLTQGGNQRFFYCYDTGTKIYVLSGYEKKTEKIPMHELNYALEIKRRYGL